MIAWGINYSLFVDSSQTLVLRKRRAEPSRFCLSLVTRKFSGRSLPILHSVSIDQWSNSVVVGKRAASVHVVWMEKYDRKLSLSLCV